MSLEASFDPGPYDGKALRSSKGSESLGKSPAMEMRL